MLFGSAAVFAIFLAGGTFSSVRPSPCPWSPSAGCERPLTAPLPALDLRQIASPPSASTTDLLRRRMAVEVKYCCCRLGARKPLSAEARNARLSVTS